MIPDLWPYSILLVHSMCLIGLVLVVRAAPCPLQALAIGIMLCAFLVYVSSDIAWIFYGWRNWRVKEVGDNILQIGVTIYIFRLFADEQMKKVGGSGAWRRSYKPSHS